VHWTAYGLWPVAFLHALGNGTDATTTWFRAVALACAAAVAVAVGWRTTAGYAGRGIPRVARRAVTR
jgi:sulfoxide reductase heme-binding subunit YedZ